jgi:phenylalanyl-tRNA synthetase beta chain
MNIKITYNWLLEYLDTDATPQEMQKYLALCGPAIERVDKVGDDYVFDIEITSNRVDMASVFGIAQEAQAILPQFGKKAKLKKNPFKEYHFGSDAENKLPLTITTENEKLGSRIAAVVMADATIKPSPELIQKRLEMCDIRPINNVVDITNYLMLELGQPAHVFDYDKIEGHTMKIRESKKGETVTTLDKKEITLPGGDIVIEDGSGTLIDLCGIMGGLGSSVTEQTKNVVLFIQTWNKRYVRKTSMTTGQRSVAATYFEKGLDEERVEPTMVYGIEFLQKNAGAAVASAVTDMFPAPYKPVTVTVSNDFIVSRIGVDVPQKTSQEILENLGFDVTIANNTFTVTVPPTRKYDVAIPEDIVEEIARIYGYHNLPNNISPMTYIKQPHEIEQNILIQQKIKLVLKHLGMHESMNYSMVSQEMLDAMGLEAVNHLRVANSISSELTFMRTSLLPSLVKNIRDNQGKAQDLRFFEIAKVYYPQENDLPKEIYKVALATNTSWADIKGIVEAMLRELGITDYELGQSKIHIFSAKEVVDFMVDGSVIGSIGRLAAPLQAKNELKTPVYLASFDLLSLIAHTRIVAQYVPINPYATIKLDLNVKTGKMTFEQMKKESMKASSLLQNIELVDTYKDTLTLRFYFSSKEKNLTEKEASEELEKIKKLLI